MADKELRSMNRMELIEIIYALQQNERQLREEKEELQRQMEDRIVRLERSGSIAEAALDLNHIFEDAQNAAEQYLDSLRDKDERASQALADAEEKAGDIISSAKAKRSQTEDECRVMREMATRGIQQQIDALTRSASFMTEKYPDLSAQTPAETVNESFAGGTADGE